MSASIKTIAIGIFVLIAAAIVVFMLLYIHPTVGDNAKTLRIRFTDVDKIDRGTRITYAGRPVGEVVSIKEVPEARTNRLSFEGDVYVYEIEAKVDSSVDVYNTDEITVRTSGLLGEKNIEINPLPPKAGQPIFKVENQILYAAPVGTVESALKSFSGMTQKIEATLDNIQETIQRIKKEEIVEGVSKITKNLVEITHALNQPEKWSQAVDNVTLLADKANKSWDSADNAIQNFSQLSNDFKQAWPKMDHALNQVAASSDQIYAASANAKDFSLAAKHMMDHAKMGEGTLGQLFMGNDLYLEAKALMHKGSNLMNAVNQFGLLFQNNKRWQRLEGQRQQLVQRLSNPYEFSNYFNNEMNRISSSLSEVSMLLNENNPNDPYSLSNNSAFTARFSQLIKEVEGMEETIKLYNEQLVGQGMP